ncbi:helix-turn-helix transcriptional regulator [Pararhodobacter sp.]|uniref:helix-turn-helix transcriptional regulator n=1 Tax=Pararhodobacter sp. TaxID=2127056 RepID=UPI002FDE3A0B
MLAKVFHARPIPESVCVSDYHHAITHIYDAAADHLRWKQALNAVADCAGARAGALLVRDFGDMPFSITALSSAYSILEPAGQVQYYMEKLAQFEAPQWDFISRMRLGQIERDEEMGIPRADLDLRPDYVFLRGQIGTLRRLAFRLNDNRGWFDGVTLAFPAEVTHVPQAAINVLRPLLPHMAKSIEIGRTFIRLKERYHAVLAMLDKVAIGLVMALETGEIVIANREAERTLSLQDGIGKSLVNRLVLRDSDESAQLQAHVAAMARTASGEASAVERVMRCTRPSGLHPFLIEVVPLRDSGAEIERNLQGALVILVDPESQTDLNVGSFAVLHQLTPAETQVCDMLIRGYQAPEIAEIRNTSLATARNQIAAVYLKTATRRRGDLIRLVIRTLPPIL